MPDESVRSDPSRPSDPPSRDSLPVVSSGRELLAITALLMIPIAVVPAANGSFAVVTLWGLLTTGSELGPVGVRLYPVWSYFLDQPRPFGSLPASIRVWPIATAFHVLATVSAAAGVAVGREDRRVTAGLLVLGALATLSVAFGVAGRVAGGLVSGGPGGGVPIVFPLVTVASLAVVALAYRPDVANPLP